MKTPEPSHNSSNKENRGISCGLRQRLNSVLLAGSVVFLWTVLAVAAEGTGASEQTASSAMLAGSQETISLVAAVFKAIGALILVVGIMLLLLFLVKKIGLSRSRFRPHSLIKILDIHSLAPKKHVAVLDIAGEFVVVGVTDQQINMLTKLEKNNVLTEPPADEKKADVSLPSFSAVFGKAVKKSMTGTSQDK